MVYKYFKTLKVLECCSPQPAGLEHCILYVAADKQKA